MSSMNSKQRKLVESVRTSQMNVKDARDLTLAKMVLFLVHVEELDLKEDLGVSDKIAFCEMLGLQPDFLSDRKYNLGLVDESWARLSAATNEYLKDCNALAESFD
ncbi:hypothetical protein O9K51_09931 [Purpureocillium lavendulum]|uniref:Uncharacterized protein n=1 Tax=Purpureocillium lavendulum TaxID=1247861 RepID=A0AB34FES5_9HYPO|nr:hypothetical protein O9K51_09931 [Purpureocillium lavendulum]